MVDECKRGMNYGDFIDFIETREDLRCRSDVVAYFVGRYGCLCFADWNNINHACIDGFLKI